MIMDCYEYANLLNNLRPGDADYNNTGLATLAAQRMQEEGWERVGYNECGEELMQSPANPLQQLVEAGEYDSKDGGGQDFTQHTWKFHKVCCC